MLKRGIAAVTASALALILTLSVVSASPGAQAGSASSPFQFLVAVLTDANGKGALPDSLSGLLSDLFIEDLISPHTGETLEQARTRLSTQGQSPFQFLIAVLTDANDKGVLADDISASFSDWLIENLIAPRTGETPAQVRERLSALPTPTQTRTPVDDRAALVALYNATDGPNWLNNTNWLTDRPLSEWHGVNTDSSGRVTELILLYNRLSGGIPSQLGNLSRLMWLDLDRNGLSGNIPPQLGDLSKLEFLNLGTNQLSGNIPSQLGNLSRLMWLDLDGNQLSGSIPPQLGNLSKLRNLHLGGNQLSGNIPPQLGNLSELRRLGLGDNKLRGPTPPELGNLSNLTWLYLGGNQLNGCVPATLRDVQKNYLDYLGLPFCDGAPVPTPRYSIETRDREYGYTIEIPDGWVEEGEGRYYGVQESGGSLRVQSQELERGATLKQYAESVRDNLRQEWWPSASLFEITSFQKERAGNREFYSLHYRVQENPMYCALAVHERIYLADSLAGNPHGFRASVRFCDWQLELPGSRQLMMRLLDSFRIVTKRASYYTQFIIVEGIAVKASSKVRSVSMYNAAEIIETMMTSLREDIQECLVRTGAELAISPKGEFITTLPEFTPQKGELDFAGGLGAVRGQPVSGVVESTLLGSSGESLGVTYHEFAHAVQNLCFTRYEYEWWNRLYSEAQQANLFPNAYGMINSDEFFAEFSVSYFQQPYAIQWHWASDVELTRQKLSTDLPEIFDFLGRIYPGFEVDSDAAPAPTFGTNYGYRTGDRGSWIHR